MKWFKRRSTEFCDKGIKEYYWVGTGNPIDPQVVCCKIPNDKDMPLIVNAPEMLECLEKIVRAYNILLATQGANSGLSDFIDRKASDWLADGLQNKISQAIELIDKIKKEESES